MLKPLLKFADFPEPNPDTAIAFFQASNDAYKLLAAALNNYIEAHPPASYENGLLLLTICLHATEELGFTLRQALSSAAVPEKDTNG